MRWILGTVSILIIGILFQLGFLVYSTYVLLGILLISRWLTHQWAAGITAYRSPNPPRAELGETLDFAFSIENRGQLSVSWLLFEDSLPHQAMERIPPALALKGKRPLGLRELEPGEAYEAHYQLTFNQRGYYQIGPLLIETGDLFGLHRTFRIITDPNYVLVRPKVIPLRDYQLASRRPVGEVEIAHRLFEDPTRIAAVRPFQPGDSLNQIHWRATARTGVFHSRVYENSCVAGATLVLDFHDLGYEGSGAHVTRELAVTVAASLANTVFESGNQVGLVTNGRDAAERIKHTGAQGEFKTRKAAQTMATSTVDNDRRSPIVVPTRKGADQMSQILDTLGRLEPGSGLNFSELLQEASHLLPRDATVIPILRDVSEETALSLGMLRNRGFAIHVIFVQFDEGYQPSWAKAPSWAEPIVAQGIDFMTVANEDDLRSLFNREHPAKL